MLNVRCFLAIQYSSVENSLFSFVPYFLVGLFGSLESKFLSSLYILDISPLSDIGLVKIFSHSFGSNFETGTLNNKTHLFILGYRMRETAPPLGFEQRC